MYCTIIFYHCNTCSIYGSFRPEIKYLYLKLIKSMFFFLSARVKKVAESQRSLVNAKYVTNLMPNHIKA